MSAIGQTCQQLQQELQNELTTANQLLRLMYESIELQQIKEFTNAGAEFETNIKQNASLVAALASIQQVDLDNIPPMQRKHIDMSNHTNQNISYEQHDSFRNTSDMDQSQ